MSIKLVLAVRDSGPVDKISFDVLAALADQSNDFGESCFPSYATLATMTRYCRRTVIRAVQRLEREGWISVQRDQTRKNGSFTANQFKLHLEPLGLARKPNKIASDSQSLPSDSQSPPSDSESPYASDSQSPADTTLTTYPSEQAGFPRLSEFQLGRLRRGESFVVQGEVVRSGSERMRDFQARCLR